MRRILPVMTLLATLSLAHAQGTFYRAADGKWKPLRSTAAGPITKFSLSPDDIGGGSTMVVLDKPKWMVLDDDAAPAIVKVLLDGEERKAEELNLGQIAKAPAELAFAVKDDKNPLDLAGLSVALNGKPLPSSQVTVAKLEGDKFVRVAVKLGDLPAAKYGLVAQIADMSPARNVQTLTLSFSTAPLVTNGSFEDTDNTGKPLAWNPGSWGSDDPTTFEWSVQPGGIAGQKALRVTSTKGGNLTCSNEMDPLKPDTPYVVTGQYKSPQGIGVSIITYDSGGERPDYLTQNFPAAKDWTPFSYEFKVKPHVKSSVVLRTGSKGETWFDDIKVNLK
ncbi:MAG: carbohydrate binding domain-containing protein [Armatimonadota bacterium]